MTKILIFIGIIVLIAFIRSSWGWFKHYKNVKAHNENIMRQYENTWGCPRCQSRVSNDLKRCSCGQPAHNSGRG